MWQMKLGTVEDHVYKFYLNRYFDKYFKCGDDGVKVMLGQTLNHIVQISVALCSVISY
jgi:hypothetical protein